MSKKTVLFHSNYCGSKTGFGGFVREILTYLHKTGKYELHLYAAGITDAHPDFDKWPWQVHGALPNNTAELDALQKADPTMWRMASYGAHRIDAVVKQVKPDVYIGVEDPWGLGYAVTKPWWGKFPCMIHTTLDSRPIVPMALEMAKKTPYFFSWADFATKEMHKSGLHHVKTLRGTVNTEIYRRLSGNERQELRRKHNIPLDAFCIGMLSRNQPRKSFPTLIQAYAQFRKENPEVKNARLLLFTNFAEGWKLADRIQEYGIDPNEVLAAYKCRATGQCFFLPFSGHELNNPVTGHEKSLTTVSINDGLTDAQTNDWYNLLDVYAHPFTSGGQERSIQEAKLTELITLVTNYSCGEDNCEEGAGSLPLSFSEYREIDSELIKAATEASSIVFQLLKVYRMSPEKRRLMGTMARKWVLANFSIEVIGAEFEKILDAMPVTNYDFKFDYVPKNQNAVIPNLPDDKEWVKTLYKAILLLDVGDEDAGLQNWLKQLGNNMPREKVEAYFRDVAIKENVEKQAGVDLTAVLGNEESKDRILICIPESLGDCLYITALLDDARLQYADKKIYVACKSQFMDVFRPLVGYEIDAVIEWSPAMDDSMRLEGYGTSKGYFHVVLQPHFFTQRIINYLHHGEDRSAITLTM